MPYYKRRIEKKNGEKYMNVLLDVHISVVFLQESAYNIGIKTLI